MVSQNTRPICDYENSQYQTEFWDCGNREYEDKVERIALQKLLPKTGKRCLEIGAGAGRLTQELNHIDHIVLLDYSRSQIEQAQNLLGNSSKYTFVVADAYKPPFADQAFDAALMVRIIHHLTDPQHVLSLVNKLLKPNGCLVLEFANKRNIKSIIRYLLNRQSWNPFSYNSVEYNKLNLNFHPNNIMHMLSVSDFTVGEKRSVSHFRWKHIKQLVPTNLLVSIDSALQTTGRYWQFTPSVLLQAFSNTNINLNNEDKLFKCPTCNSKDIVESPTNITCPNCGHICTISNGIYDFKLSD